MGNGVVHVHEVQLVFAGRIVEGHRQSQGVGWMLEEGVTGHLHLVEIDALPVSREAERLVVGDEVHLVPPIREEEAQLRGDGPGASVCRIAGDADLHASSPLTEERARAAPARSSHVSVARRTRSSRGAVASMRTASSGSW